MVNPHLLFEAIKPFKDFFLYIIDVKWNANYYNSYCCRYVLPSGSTVSNLFALTRDCGVKSGLYFRVPPLSDTESLIAMFPLVLMLCYIIKVNDNVLMDIVVTVIDGNCDVLVFKKVPPIG